MANSKIKTKVKIQEILTNNIINPIADFHSEEFDDIGFLHDLHKNFKLIPKEKGKNTDEVLEKILKLSTSKVIGMFNAKEIKKIKFINELFKNFEIKEL